MMNSGAHFPAKLAFGDHQNPGEPLPECLRAESNDQSDVTDSSGRRRQRNPQVQEPTRTGTKANEIAMQSCRTLLRRIAHRRAGGYHRFARGCDRLWWPVNYRCGRTYSRKVMRVEEAIDTSLQAFVQYTEVTMSTSNPPSDFRFGTLKLLPHRRLRKNGMRIRCQEQPIQVLVALLERPESC